MNNSKFKLDSTIFYSICAMAFIFFLFKAWASEDSFITARVIDNFVNGYGLRWNVDERVQVYTHPLWMLIHIPFYWITGNFFYTTIAIGITCTISAVYLLLKTAKLDKITASIFVILPLVLSRSFGDYATSGLENSLSYLLISSFAYVIFKNKDSASPPWFLLSFITSLALLTRLDMALIYAPIMLYLMIKHFKSIRISHLLAGGLPIILWEIFSLIYYGFFLPNTKYAKLNTGHSLEQFISQGLIYVKDFAIFDSVSCVFIIIVSFITIITKHKNKAILVALMTGVISYCLYIVYIGGDYMSGRFFSVPFFVSMIVFAMIIQEKPTRKLIILPILLTICFAISTTYIFSKHHVFMADNDSSYFIDEETRIHDERGWSWRHNHLISLDILNRGGKYTDHRFAKKGIKYNQRGQECAKPSCYVADYYAVGMAGYLAGPNVTIIDLFALTDPLLSRITLDNPVFSPGHYYRELPRGYKYARQTGDFDKLNPPYQEYYGYLKLITAGEIFTIERFKTIIGFMFYDYYDELLAGAIEVEKMIKEDPRFIDEVLYE